MNLYLHFWFKLWTIDLLWDPILWRRTRRTIKFWKKLRLLCFTLCDRNSSRQWRHAQQTSQGQWHSVGNSLYISYIPLLGTTAVYVVFFVDFLKNNWLTALMAFPGVTMKKFTGWGRVYRQPQHAAGFTLFDLCGHLSRTIPAKLAKYGIMLPLFLCHFIFVSMFDRLSNICHHSWLSINSLKWCEKYFNVLLKWV